MTTAVRPSSAPASQRVSTSASNAQRAAERFLEALYGDAEGWIDQCVGKNDPTDPTKIIFYTVNPKKDYDTPRWGWNGTSRRRMLAERLIKLAQKYGNVYMGVRLYANTTRSIAEVMPSQWIFVDDLPADPAIKPTMLVQTSEHSYHGYYRVDRPLDAAEGKQWSQRVQRAVGGDPSGVDMTQLVRVPGTYNTKRGGRFPVTLEYTNGPTYTLEQLDALTPAVESFSPPEGHRTAYTGDRAAAWAAMDHAKVDSWLGMKDRLINEQGIPRRFNPTAPSAKLLKGEAHILKPDGTPDHSRMRAAVAEGLVRYGYPDEEAVAILFTICDYGRLKSHGPEWLFTDCASVVQYHRAKHPNVTINPTRIGGSPAPRPVDPLPSPDRLHKGKGRPAQLTAEALHAWYERNADAGCVWLTLEQVAAEHKVSRRTICRLEGELRAAGVIERRTTQDRTASWVTVGGSDKNITDPVTNNSASSAANERPTAPQSDELSSVKNAAEVVTKIPCPDAAQNGTGGGENEALRVRARKENHHPPMNTAPARGGAAAVIPPSPAPVEEQTPLVGAIGVQAVLPDQSVAVFDPTVPSADPEVNADGVVGEVTVIDEAVAAMLAILDATDRRPHPRTVAAMLEAVYPAHSWHPDRIRAVYDAAMDRRKVERELERLTSMRVSQLQGYRLMAERKCAESQQHGTNAWRFWYGVQCRIEKELERRKDCNRKARTTSPRVARRPASTGTEPASVVQRHHANGKMADNAPTATGSAGAGDPQRDTPPVAAEAGGVTAAPASAPLITIDPAKRIPDADYRWLECLYAFVKRCTREGRTDQAAYVQGVIDGYISRLSTGEASYA